MRKHQVWGFNFISKNTNDAVNVLTGTCEECEDEVQITCFDGIASFKTNVKGKVRYYCIKYPKISKLNNHDKEVIMDYCGYEPMAGEYGVICGALGVCTETDKKTYDDFSKEYCLEKC